MTINNIFQIKLKFSGLKKGARKILKKKLFRRIILAAGFLVFGLAAGFFAFNLAYTDKVLPHTYIGSTDFGGLRRTEAESKFTSLVFQTDGQLNYRFEGKTYVRSQAELGIDYSGYDAKTADRLLAIGRSGGIRRILKETILAMFSRNQVLAAFALKDDELNNYLATIAKEIDRPEKDATIEIHDNKPKVIPEEIGRRFELEGSRQVALEHIGSLSFPSEMPFLVSVVYPRIDASTAEEAIPETERLLGRHLTITAREKTLEIKPEDMAGLLEFVGRLNDKGLLENTKNRAKVAVKPYKLSPEISSAKVGAKLEPFASEVNQPPKDPQFKVSGGRVTAFRLAQTGYELDKEQAVGQIIEALKNEQEKLELKVKVTEPAVTGDDPAELGLKEIIGEGTTSWRGSPPNRIHNLSLGAEKISGTIVKPGETFSTIKAIGDISAAAGFLPELVIKNSTQVTPEIGGGLCQVSTTLFRAVLNSGLKIIDRTAHSFRVSYYEPPVGMDATIYDPAPDLKFINNMETPIFIWGEASNNGLDFQIFGTKDGRKIEISDPVVYDYTSAGAPIYTESDSMAPGEIRQTERATSGASASFHYKVTSAAGEVLQEETFTSKYVPIPDSFLYGPGTEGIPGQEPSPPAQVEATQAPTPTPSPSPTTRKR